VIIAKGLAVEAGGRVLVTEADLALYPGDKAGLVGRNGAGKTTLLRTLAGLRSPAAGTVASSGVIGYLSQEAALPELEHPEASALERILSVRRIGALSRQMEAARHRMAATTGPERDRAIGRFARLEAEFELAGGYRAESEARRFGASVGITDDEMAQPVATMSGGQRRRVELARVLFAETDLLLLDEPTNHLDLDAKAWLVGFLGGYAGGLVVVSHDLPLLDASITSVLAFEEGRLEHYRGNYSHYLGEGERRREQRRRQRRHQEEQLAQMEATIRRFKGKTEKMARRAGTMETRAGRLRNQLVEVGTVHKGVSVRFPQPRPSGRVPLEGLGLGKAYGDNVVFVDVSLHLERGERLLILGLNGAGKTTLLRLLAGVEAPDLGTVTRGAHTSVGYYAQEHEGIQPDATVLDHLRAVSPEPDRVLRGILGHFLLADRIDQPAGTLSGGEKTKLALAQLVAGRHNLLLLDEPTNNLDPQAKAALLAALRGYQGTVVLVSHDAAFVAELAPDRAVLMPEGDTAYFDDSLLDLVSLA
jgi:ATPase subunit of ABC transporter with duplicated ATPase domains